MNGYSVQDVGAIVLGMDSVVGIGLKEQMFGSVSSLAKLDTKGEIEREQFIDKGHRVVRFHHLVDLKTLVNGILHAQVQCH